MNQKLCFLNDNGEICGVTLFAPLIEMLFPAFVQHAEEICITFSLVTSGEIAATYNKGGENFPLHIKTEFHPADVFVRVRILADISITASEGHYIGEITMRFKGRIIKVFVEFDIEKIQETIRLKPLWET